MALKGTFIADFESFFTACDQAVIHLADMEAGASKAEGQLNRMVAKFSGQEVIAQARLMSEAFERLSAMGIKPVEADLAQMHAVADDAIAKLIASGKDVPEAIGKWATPIKLTTEELTQLQTVTAQTVDEFERSGGAAGKFGEGLRVADKTLGAMGVNVSGLSNVLAELGLVAGTTLASLGLLGAGAVILGVTLAGLKLGKLLEEWTNLDDLGRNIADWMGNLSVKTAEQAAVQDVLNRAIEAGADTTITYSEAIDFNNKKHAERVTALKLNTKSVEELRLAEEKLDTARKAMLAWQAEAMAASDALEVRLQAQRNAMRDLNFLTTGYGTVLRAMNPEILAQAANFLKLGAPMSTIIEAFRLTAVQAAAVNQHFAEMGGRVDAVTASMGALSIALPGVGASFIALNAMLAQGMDATKKKYDEDVAAMLKAADDANQAIAKGFGASTTAVNTTTAATHQLIQGLNAAEAAAMSLYEKMQAAMSVNQAYEAGGISVLGTAAEGYWFDRASRSGSQISAGNALNLNVNVNNTEAGHVARAIVTDLRHQGVRFGA